LVKKAENWKWSSLWRREYGTAKQRRILSPWPTNTPRSYLKIVNEAITNKELERLEQSEEKSIPFGKDMWVDKMVKRYGIKQVLRGVGRPRKGG